MPAQPRPIPITDPATLAAIRRLVRVEIAVLLAVYAGAWVLHLTLPFSVWILISAMIPVYIASALFFTARRRILGAPMRIDAVLPHPLGLIDSVVRGLIPWVPLWMSFAWSTLPMSWVNGFVAMPLIFGGLLTAGLAMFLREARPPCCPKCQYPVAALEFPLKCPECAHPMPWPDSATTTPRVPHRGIAGAGIAAMVLGLALIITVFARPAVFYSAMPRVILLRSAAANPDAFAALNPAVFTQAERESLARRVMDERLRGADFPFDLLPQLNWLGAEIAARRLDATFAERYAFEGFELSILQNPKLTHDEPDGICIGGSPPVTTANALRVGFFFAGFEIDDGPPIGRDTQERPLPPLEWTFTQRTNPTPVPFLPLVIDRPTHIRARIIVFVLPRAPSPPPAITWHDDGSYTITPTPLTTRELTAETTLEPTP